MRGNFVRILFFVFIVVLIAASLLTYRNLENYIDEVAGIRHSNRVISMVQLVLASVRDAETGHRGYQLTRDTTYLDPYYNALKKLPSDIVRLDSMTASNELQSRRVDTLGILVNVQFSIINQILSNAKRSSLYMDQYESALLLRGKRNMDQIRNICKEIVEDEQASFRERVTKETAFRENAPLTVLAYTLVALVGMTFLFTRALDSLSKLRVVEESLRLNVQELKHEESMRKKAEKDMLISERLSVTGKIARTIAHEVRNPLTNLTLALEQMKDEMPPDNEAVKQYSEIIQRNAGRIEQLVGEMLNSSRPKELNLELTDIDFIIEESLALTIDRINLNQMKLIKRLAPGLPRILLDREQMRIALINMIINAVEAMENERGVLTIETKKTDREIILSISDNGKGISSEELEKLFDPFYTGKKGGIGLGLTSTRNILNSHSAGVEVKSEVNKGTTFVIRFKLPPE